MKYYDLSKLLSYHKPLYISLGNRNIGKTFAFKKHIIHKFLKNKEEFIILCRFKDEVNSLMKDYFIDVGNIYYKDYIFTNKSNRFYMVDKRTNKKMLIGYCYAVNQYLEIKKHPHPKVCTILFDEFLNEENNYIKNKNKPNLEVEMLLNIYQSIARGDGHIIRNNVKIILISNTITTANPYFDYFKIDTLIEKNQDNKKTKIIKSEGLVIEIKYDLEVARIIEKSKFNKLIKSTDYNEFAQNNKFYLDNNALIKTPPQNLKLHILYIIYDNKFYLLSSQKNIYYFYQTKKIINNIPKFTYTDKDHRTNYLNFRLLKQNELYNMILETYYNGDLFFDKQITKNIFLLIFSQL